MNNFEIIKNTLLKNNISANDQQVKQLEKYFEILIEYNKNINLTAITEIKDVASKHFADSLITINLIKKNSTLLDVGTGAGFPGIPIKILRPDLNITLVDSLNKRVNFLNTVINELNLTNIQAIHSRAQDLINIDGFRESFDYTTSRAVSKLNILAEYSIPYLKINGEMLAYKSGDITEEINNSQQAFATLYSKVDKVLNTVIHSLTGENYSRSIIVIKKLKNTSEKYPRQKNLIEKYPL